MGIHSHAQDRHQDGRQGLDDFWCPKPQGWEHERHAHLPPSTPACFLIQSDFGVRDFSHLPDPREEHPGRVGLGDTCWRTQTAIANPPAPGGCWWSPSNPFCRSAQTNLGTHFHDRVRQPPLRSTPEPSLGDLWCTETQFTLQKALIRPWKAIKRELHTSVKGFASWADVLLADAPTTSRSDELCSTLEPRQGEGPSCSWSARLIFIRPFSGNKKYGKAKWSSPAAAGVDYGAGSSRNALRKAPSNG